MLKKWSKRRFFYLAIGLNITGVLIMAMGGVIDSGLLITFGIIVFFGLSPIAWLLWLVRALIKSD